VYAAYIVIGFAIEIALGSPWGLAVAFAGFVYYDFRTREEERWLKSTYPDFDAYLHVVKGRLIPGIY
jgi:protein-S-isoprenylcysteine O-methyltransferase Ste14